MALLLLEAYILTCDKQKQADHFRNVSTEKLFYFSFFLTLIGKRVKQFFKCTNYLKCSHSDKLVLLLLLRAVATTHLNDNELIYHYTEQTIITFLFKTIVLAGLAKLFLLPIVVWHSNNTGTSVHLFLVTGYYFLSLANVYAVIVNCSQKYASAQLVMVLLVKMMICEVSASAVDGWKLFQNIFQE